MDERTPDRQQGGAEITDPQPRRNAAVRPRPAVTDIRVAVAIAARNAEDTIGRAVSSALAERQTAEVVVVDDASTDDTYHAALDADDGTNRLRLMRLRANVGPAAARNVAIAGSCAPYIAILDADDYWLPGRLERLAVHVPGCDFVADDLSIVDEVEDGRAALPLIGGWKAAFEITLPEFLDHNISRRGHYRREWGFLKPLIRRDFLKEANLAYDPDLILGEDFVLYAQALARGARFRIVGPCGYVAVERKTSITATHTAAHLDALLTAARKLKSEPMDPRSQEALKHYLRHLKAKTRYRQVLEARRQGGLAAVASLLLSDVDALPSAVLGRLENVAPPRLGASRARPFNRLAKRWRSSPTGPEARPGC